MNKDESNSVDVEPVYGKLMMPLRLFTQDGRPVTDDEGFILKNIVGKELALINVLRNCYKDMKGLNLTDAKGRFPNDCQFDPTTIPDYQSDTTRVCELGKSFGCHTTVYDINGFPLCDRNGRPLLSRTGEMYLMFDPRGLPISDTAGRDVIDKFGEVLTRHKPLKNKQDEPLFMFDQDGRPLTDPDSFPLLDITGLKMVLFDDCHVPYGSLTGSEIFDAEGIPNGEPECDFTKRPRTLKSSAKITTETGEPGVAFDSCGYPLTDLLGNLLCLSNGNPMATNVANTWITISGENATIMPRRSYDRFSLKGFTNSSGQPIRLFDDYGRPLTDLSGVPQRHASGKLLIKFDEDGAPISDWLNRPLYDANGCTNNSPRFRPCIPFNKANFVEKILSGIPRNIQYFECTGMPLTNKFGQPLLNALEVPMVVFDNSGEPLHDNRKKRVYNALGLPTITSLDYPIIGPGGLPVRVYDREGRPLTDSSGYVLKDVRGRYMIKMYSKNSSILDIKGREVYDKHGNSTKSQLKFNASSSANRTVKQETVIGVDGEPILLFDEDGFPLTDKSGIVLCNRLGKSMIKCPEQGFTVTLDDKPVYDEKGRKCMKTFSQHIGLSVGLYDKNSRPLTDRFGSVLHNRKGQELVLFDKNMRPTAVDGGELYDLKGMLLSHPFADPSHIAKNPLHQVPDGVQLFDCEDLPLTDSSGCLLYTSFGVPLLNFEVHGRIKCDHSGRPVFDVRGFAVSRTSGAWKDQTGKPYRLFDSDGWPLTDEDGRELHDIEGKSLVKQDNVGRPKHTFNDGYVRDANGRRYIDIQFKPTQPPSNAKKSFVLCEENKSPLRLYDKSGRPLTDAMGRAVINSKGDFGLNMKHGFNKITDLDGQRVYDRCHMPLGCSAKTPIKTMSGVTLMLYDERGIPLTDGNGLPLRNGNANDVMIVFDMFGRPSSTQNGSKVYDHSGRSSQHLQFGLNEEMDRPCTVNDERLITVYDRDGHPLVDSVGQSLQ